MRVGFAVEVFRHSRAERPRKSIQNADQNRRIDRFCQMEIDASEARPLAVLILFIRCDGDYDQ